MGKVIDISARIIDDMANDFIHFTENEDIKGIGLLRQRINNMLLRSVPKTTDYKVYSEMLKHIDRWLLKAPKQMRAKRTLRQF